jgi:hypothetical protein
MSEIKFQLIAAHAVDTAYSRIGLSKPSDMISLIHSKLGPDAARSFALGAVDSYDRNKKDNK